MRNKLFFLYCMIPWNINFLNRWNWSILESINYAFVKQNEIISIEVSNSRHKWSLLICSIAADMNQGSFVICKYVRHEKICTFYWYLYLLRMKIHPIEYSVSSLNLVLIFKGMRSGIFLVNFSALLHQFFSYAIKIVPTGAFIG